MEPGTKMRTKDRTNGSKRSSERGATVLETVVVLAIIVLFAGIVAPEVRNYFVRAKAAKICAVYHMVAKGAMEYWSDTGHYAVEDSADPDENAHQLFYKPNPHLPGWSGAYINHPLSMSDNPFKQEVRLVNNLAQASTSGFDLDCPDPNPFLNYEVQPSAGNAIVFDLPAGTLTEDPIIVEVEKTLEKNGYVDPTMGRVMVTGPNNSHLAIFIFQMP